MVKGSRPNSPLELVDDDLTSYGGALFRIFKAGGMRYFGPVPKMRFDPQPPPPGIHTRGVMYAACDFVTPFAEVFQRTRVIAGSSGSTVVGWKPIRPLLLVDLTSDFLIRNGASASLMMGPKLYTQAWAQAIDAQYGDRVDGLWHLSAMRTKPMVTLFERSILVPSFPASPTLHRGVDDPLLRAQLARVARTIKFGLR